ncbi:MAG: hypothetical protein KAX46_00495 [Chromatiaceae bacterium]|nr:hypothetical protein [Chromatiaceae bacterium]
MTPLDRLDWLRLVMGSPVASPHTKIALAIALRINGQTGECYPSKACLCCDTGMSDASVRRGVLALVNAGLLSVTFSNGRLANRYRLLMASSSNPSTHEGVDASNPVTHDPVTPSNPVTHEGVNPSTHEGVKTPTPSPMTVNPFTHDARNKGMNMGKKKELSLSLSQPSSDLAAPTTQALALVPPVAKVATDWPGFDEFWAAYPRGDAKKATRALWNKLRLPPETVATILADIHFRLSQHDGWQNKRFIPHPSTYLNGERWQDSIIPKLNGSHHVPRSLSKIDVYTHLDSLSSSELFGYSDRREERVTPGEVL